MPGFLFHEVVFGPVRSRRLGLSLGINLLPLHSKHCTFNCIYCECGWTPPDKDPGKGYPSREEVSTFLEQRLKELVREEYIPDSLTFAGNGEPTLHPEFAAIVEDTLHLRDRYVPSARTTVLSNASMLHRPDVFHALQKLDNNIQKLDAGAGRLFNLINNPVEPVVFQNLMDRLQKFNGNVIIQSMFLRGNFNGEEVDNTLPEEVDRWLEHLVEIRPKLVMIYSIDRATPLRGLEKISRAELELIAVKVRDAGLEVQVY